MGSNREERIDKKYVHLYLAFSRKSHGFEERCIRSVCKDTPNELESFEAKLKAIGGYWRIHRTVNARDVEKARVHLICNLVRHPEKAAYVDSEWRTSLLQPDCIYGKKKFMLDIDTQDEDKLQIVEDLIPHVVQYEGYEESGAIIDRIKSVKGWHYITKPFDTREVCSLDYVSLIRDGYFFVKEVNPQLFHTKEEV